MIIPEFSNYEYIDGDVVDTKTGKTKLLRKRGDYKLKDEFGPLTPSEDKPFGGTLDQWEIKPFGEYELAYGILKDDPMQRWRGGAPIRTSYLMKKDLENKTIETRNTKYALGEPFVLPDFSNEEREQIAALSKSTTGS